MSQRWALLTIVLCWALREGRRTKKGFYGERRVHNGISSFFGVWMFDGGAFHSDMIPFCAVTSEKLIISINSAMLQIAVLDTHRPKTPTFRSQHTEKSFSQFVPPFKPLSIQPRVKNLNWKLCYDWRALSDSVLSHQTSVELRFRFTSELSDEILYSIAIFFCVRSNVEFEFVMDFYKFPWFWSRAGRGLVGCVLWSSLSSELSFVCSSWSECFKMFQWVDLQCLFNCRLLQNLIQIWNLFQFTNCEAFDFVALNAFLVAIESKLQIFQWYIRVRSTSNCWWMHQHQNCSSRQGTKLTRQFYKLIIQLKVRISSASIPLTCKCRQP